MRKLGLSVAALVAVLLAGFVVSWRVFVAYLAAPASSAVKEPTIIEVPPGLQVEGLAAMLSSGGLVARPDWFVAYLRHMRGPAALIPGEYALSPSMSPVEIADRIARGAVVQHPITVAAGARASEIVKQLADARLADETELKRLLSDPSAAARLEVPGTAFEGYLFPDTYSFARGLAPEAILKRMVQRYRAVVTPEILDAARQNDLVEHQLVTLASLIQAAPMPRREWPQLSAVYHNRLRSGMPLEDAAGLAYGLGKPLETVTREDESIETPYNTFLRLGLPPSPICSPSLEAIQAAANPVASDAHYYASRGDGGHVFCPDEECLRIELERAGLSPIERVDRRPKKKRRIP